MAVRAPRTNRVNVVSVAASAPTSTPHLSASSRTAPMISSARTPRSRHTAAMLGSAASAAFKPAGRRM